MTATIYINGRFLTQPLSGVQRYAEEIVRSLDRLVGSGGLSTRCVLLTPTGARHAGLTNIEQREVGRLRGHAWDQVTFARAARSGVALCLAMTGPVLLRRQVVVIHDAAVQRHPEHFSRSYGQLHGMLDYLLARRATVATVSRFSQGELAAVLPVRASDIVVAPNGAEHLRIEADGGIVHRLGLVPGRYFLTLGNLTKNKNLAVALRAMQRLPGGEERLVAVGRIDPGVFGSGDLPAAGSNVLFPGRLSDAEVAGLMQSACALIFPSIYEGFGIPPLEAFVNNCLVLASTAPAINEVCGPAARYFDPHDDSTLARLMTEALDLHPAERAERVALGRGRVSLYSWDASARILASECERLIGRAA